MSARGWRSLPRIGRRDVAAEMRAELEAHIAMQTEDLIAEGCSPDHALHEAARRFGDRRAVERELLRIDHALDRQQRHTQHIEDVMLDIRLALRQLRRQPLFGVIAIVIMALGIGANAAVFAVVDGALLRPLPLRNGAELVYLFEGESVEGASHATMAEFREYERNATFLQGIVGAYSTGFTVQDGGDAELVIGGVLAGDPETVFGIAPLLGRWFTQEEVRTGARVVLLDESFWRSRFGGRTDVLGQTLRINDAAFIVTGVLPHTANLLSPGSQVALWTTLREEPWMAGEIHFLRALGRLAPGIDMEEAARRSALLATASIEQRIGHEPILLVTARSLLVGDVRSLLLLMFGAVLLLLLIVCANLANLFLARGLERGREFAVRASLGAGQARLLRQVMTEGLVLGMLGGAAGLGLAHTFIGVIRGLSGSAGALSPTSSVDARVVLFTLMLSVAVGLLFSLWPALRAGQLDLGRAMRDGDGRTTSGPAGWERRRALVAVEVGLCVLLLAGAGLLVRSMWQVLREDPGFHTDHTLTAGVMLRGDRYDNDAALSLTSRSLIERVQRVPGVTAVGYVNNLPLDGSDTSGTFEIIGMEYALEDRPWAKKRVVSPGYFDALGIPLLSGRNFDERDRGGQPDVVIISRLAASRYFGDADPVGRRVTFNWGPGDEMTVIGVVGDVKHDGLDQPLEPMIYRAIAQFPQRGFALVIRTTGEPMALLQALRRELRAIDPALALYRPRTMDAIANESLATRRTFMTLMLGFALVALVLTAVGVYAICAQAVAARTRELGIRMALGATPAAVMGQVVRRELRVLAVGLLAGVVVAVPASRALSSAVYGVSPGDPVTFGIVLITLVTAGVIATVLPARRVARLDVITILRGS